MTTDLDFRGWRFRGCDIINGRVLRLHLDRFGRPTSDALEEPKGVFRAHVTFAQVSHIKLSRCSDGATVGEIAVQPQDDGSKAYVFALDDGSIAVTARDCAAITWRIN